MDIAALPTLFYPIVDGPLQYYPLPIETYAASPIVSESDLREPEAVEAIVEALGRVTDRIDGAERHIVAVVDDLRWDQYLDDA